jgi:large subunit ribosomal protein L12
MVKALVAAISEVNIDEALKAAPVALSTNTAAAEPSTAGPKQESSEAPKEEEKKRRRGARGTLCTIWLMACLNMRWLRTGSIANRY